MALGDSPRNTSILLIVLALIVGYMGYTGDGISLVGVDGLRASAVRADSMADTVATLEASIDSAKRELARGSIEDVRKQLEQFRATLSVLSDFVPDQNEVPNLLDDITSRAKIRGVTLAGFAPQPVVEGPEPFDTYGYDMSVIGRYDQVGAFLSDVAGLRRIIVPMDVSLTSAEASRARALGDTTKAMLEVKFKVQTYVKMVGGIDGR
jgi:type IV pilus assembly protein PilO